jgi:hypothetical protein
MGLILPIFVPLKGWFCRQEVMSSEQIEYWAARVSELSPQRVLHDFKMISRRLMS